MATQWQAPQEWSEWNDWLATGLHGRCRWRLPLLLSGLLFAKGRRTVTTWLRAGGIHTDFADYYYFLAAVGKSTLAVAEPLLVLALRLLPGQRVLLVVDDSPTKRYGPKVQGAGIHHNPTPGPTDQKFLYGHVWVTLSWVVRHPRWGAIGLPVLAFLYVRAKDVVTLPVKCGWHFLTKLQMAEALIVWAAPLIKRAGRSLWVVVDGWYAKRPFVQAVVKAGGVLVGRLPTNARLWEVPSPCVESKRPRGRPRKYGKHRISLAKRAGHKRGWETVECHCYGQLVTKTIKTFLATSRLVDGALRVVIVKEEHGWYAFFCTDVNASVREIVEAYADRATIEQNFHDLKEVWGTGQQQVRNIWANVGVFHLNLWMHTLVELWSWKRSKSKLCDRKASPWDNADRRPSHADRRKALQREYLEEEFSTMLHGGPTLRKISSFFRRLQKLAA
jgi:hypothetical protein